MDIIILLLIFIFPLLAMVISLYCLSHVLSWKKISAQLALKDLPKK